MTLDALVNCVKMVSVKVYLLVYRAQIMMTVIHRWLAKLLVCGLFKRLAKFGDFMGTYVLMIMIVTQRLCVGINIVQTFSKTLKSV